MALSEDLINFDLIETHKENIQQLPGGRSARQLASILSPLPSAKTGGVPGLDETKTLNDAIRQEYENELLAIADSDDPLDIYDRYVKWTLNAYPSAQATPQSQLLPLLERATKTFLTSSHYKNDPRYLKLWLHYIRFFSDAPRETFAFLARHHIGESLGLFYEEFAAWLEGAGRWNQADEVYKMGLEKEARPAERLMRKYNQFRSRYDARPEGSDEPSSPALPTVRPALAAKIDPFASASRAEDSQAQATVPAANPSKSKSGRVKMAIFSDVDNDTPPPATGATKGWDSIGSVKDRKKENTVEARSWAGETLKAGKRAGAANKMEIFRDPNAFVQESKKSSILNPSHSINPKTGRAEMVFVNLEAVYPSEAEEFSFEELRAMSRGWMSQDWSTVRSSHLVPTSANSPLVLQSPKTVEPVDVENLSQTFQAKLDVSDTSTQSIVGMPEVPVTKQRKLKVREVKQETQTVKTRLDSPTGKKLKRKGSAEPTMTFHSKAATNDIYDIFNQPKQVDTKDDTQSGDGTDYGDDTYSTAGESVHTGIISGNNSEFGDDTTRSFGQDNMSSQPESVSPWSDFTASKHIPKLTKAKNKHKRAESEDLTEIGDFNATQSLDTGAFDTVAIAALANQNFDDLDTKMIAQLAGDLGDEEEDDEDKGEGDEGDADDRTGTQRSTDPNLIESAEHNGYDFHDLKTPTDGDFTGPEMIEVHERPRFVPLPPENYEPTPMRPFRDATAVAQHKLPFMTPIVERTESSLAPSTVFQDSHYNAKTPSRLARIDHSPCKLQIDELLLHSPEKGSPVPSKRHRSTDETHDAAESHRESPHKRQVAESPVQEDHKILFPVTKLVTASADPELKNDSSVFKTSATDDKQQMGFDDRPQIKKPRSTKPQPVHKGAIIPDLQCNPIDPAVQQQILKACYPSITSYQGYIEHNDNCNQIESLRKFAKKEKTMIKSSPKKSSPRKPSSDRNNTKSLGPTLNFSGTNRVYAVKRELGAGAFAAVYLVESYDPATVDVVEHESDDPDKPQPKGTGRNALEAMKSESPASSLAWEFHILHLLKARLGGSDRAMESIVAAHECHLYRDECYLILDYHSQGTILDLVNKVRSDNVRANKPAEGLEETVAMWLGVEVLRTMEAFHKVGILHGDLKIDNCLARFEPNVELLTPYDRRGDDGWSSKGMMLIDLGRGIDIRAFKPEARFVADWKAEETDCAEIREARPWKWEIDLFGAAGIIHSLLFGKYIETIAVGGGGLGQKKEWKLKESLKRYWEKDIWSEVFHVLINGGGKSSEEIARDISRVRGSMEDWLEKEGERGGRDLRGAIRRCERLLGITGTSAGSSRGRGR